MPTGYTAKLTEHGQSFEEFVWSCARNFGALIMMRDDPADAPIRIEEESGGSSYSADSLAKGQAELERLRKLNRKECDREAAAEYARAVDEYAKREETVKAIRSRLEPMLAKVSAWTPPTPEHEGLRKFMIQQLQETLTWDGAVHGERPKKIDGYTWIQQKLAEKVRHIAYSAEHVGREEATRRSRRQWVDDLRRSVPLPAQPGAHKAKEPHEG